MLPVVEQLMSCNVNIEVMYFELKMGCYLDQNPVTDVWLRALKSVRRNAVFDKDSKRQQD